MAEVAGDLRLPPGRGLPNGLLIPADELVERFSRSSGPGGQGVNTTDSRVELSFDLAGSDALTEQQRSRALAALSGRLLDGVLTVTASEHRSQLLNRQAARDRLAPDPGRRAGAATAAPPGHQAVPGGPAATAGRQEAARAAQGRPGGASVPD